MYPLVKGGAADQFYALDVRHNPISIESYENHINGLTKGIIAFSYPTKAQSLAPCFPGSGSDASISTNRLELSWYTADYQEPIAYEVLVGQEDSLQTVTSSTEVLLFSSSLTPLINPLTRIGPEDEESE